MPQTRSCPECGAPIPADSPATFCTACLLRAGLHGESRVDSRYDPTKIARSGDEYESPTVEELARLLPQLEILRELGEGGMGAVYQARQPGLDRMVAVKVMSPGISKDPTFAERFAREARALAKLNHPNIVSVFDFGQAEGLYYIVMDYVDGQDLRQTINAGKLSPEQTLQIVSQVCAALQFAHEAGVVHRDIKPENILIDQKGTVRIADFGVAKLLDEGPGERALTGTHQVMGTLRYMAPEQIEATRDVDHRADIYSLGVVFYELLTGELPLGRFAPPSQRVQVDVRLDEVVLRALEKEPEQRYQRASELKSSVDSVSESGLNHDGRAASSSPGLFAWKHHYAPVFGIFLLTWAVVPLLWNLAVIGLLASCIIVATVVVRVGRRAERFLPSTADRWRKISPRRQWADLASAWIAAFVGAYFLALSAFQFYDHERWNRADLSPQEFRIRYQGAEHQLLRMLPRFRNDVPRAELRLNHWKTTGGVNFSVNYGPSAGLLTTISISGLALVGLVMIWMAYGTLLTFEIEGPPATAWLWRNFTTVWLTIATLAPLFPLGVAVMFWSIVSDQAFNTTASSVTVTNDFQQVLTRLHDWVDRHGYVSGDTSAWDIAQIPDGTTLAKVQTVHIWSSSGFDRWRFTSGGLQRATPDIVVHLVGDASESQTTISYSASLAPAPKGDRASDDPTIQNLLSEVQTMNR